MTNNEGGFTLIEIFITLSLFALLSSIVISIPNGMYHKILLKSAAAEIKEALYLSRQLSLDESREYCVELMEDKFRVREDKAEGKIVLTQEFNKGISGIKDPKNRISYNRSGETGYGKFVLINKKGQKIHIEILIGTGRVRISDIYTD